MADFIDLIATDIRTDIEIIAPGRALSFHGTGNAFLREGEAGSVCV